MINKQQSNKHQLSESRLNKQQFSKKQWFNFALFASGWGICLTFSNSGVILLFSLLIVITHLTLIGSWQQEKQVLLVTLLLGCAVDSFMGNLGLLEYPTENRLLPMWMGCVWLVLGITVNHAMTIFKARKIMLSITGFLFAPAHYYLATLKPDLSLSTPVWKTLTIMAVIWAIMLPLLFEFSAVWHERYKRKKL